LYVNQVVLDYHGITLEDAQGNGYRPRFFHPDDIQRVGEARQDALARGLPFENEQRLLGKDGKYRWFLVRYNPLLDQQGKIDRWYVAATDIDDRKRAEQSLQQTQFYLSEGERLAHMGSWAFNPEGFDYWSPELFRLYGLDPDREPPTFKEYL